MRPAASFSYYKTAELVLDGSLHALAILMAVAGFAWLFQAAPPIGGLRQNIGLALYGVG